MKVYKIKTGEKERLPRSDLEMVGRPRPVPYGFGRKSILRYARMCGHEGAVYVKVRRNVRASEISPMAREDSFSDAIYFYA